MSSWNGKKAILYVRVSTDEQANGYSPEHQEDRLRIYCGRIVINAYKEEGKHTIKGLHEPLIGESLFDEVQDILHRRKRAAKVRSTKDENLPLRSFLVGKSCGKPLTGSGCGGNGGRYYYNCQIASVCKERYRADVAHAEFLEMLKSISAKKEILAPIS